LQKIKSIAMVWMREGAKKYLAGRIPHLLKSSLFLIELAPSAKSIEVAENYHCIVPPDFLPSYLNRGTSQLGAPSDAVHHWRRFVPSLGTIVFFEG
jgi:hypothetical protein